jgi:hypothetical protein
MPSHLPIREKGLEMRVLERVVVRQWDLVDVVCVDELFFGLGHRSVVSAHCLKGIKLM